MDDILSRQVPYSAEAEQAVLGSVLIDPEMTGDLLEILNPADFYLEVNRLIFQVISDLFTEGKIVDPVVLLDELVYRGHGNKINRDYLMQLVESTPTASNMKEYAAIVRGKSMLRELQGVADDIMEYTRSQQEDPQTVADLAEQRIYAVRQGKEVKSFISVSDALSSVYENLDTLARNPGQLPGLPTGIRELDNYIGGLNKSDLILLAARPGMGKTAFAMNMALAAAKKTGKTVVFFQLEMSAEQIVTRLLSSEGHIDSKKLRMGRLEDEDWQDIVYASDSLKRMPILLDDNSGITVAEMKAKCRRLGDKLGLIVIDYLQLMRAPGFKGGDNRVQEVAEISRSLKIMAKDLGVPVLCCSQLSRGPEKRTNKKPMLSDLRESGSIEQDADIVMFLYRDDYYNEEGKPKTNSADLIIAKNRHGETGEIKLQWIGQYSTFVSREEIHDEA